MTVQLKVWGDMACFTRPETKADRVSYPVPTRSAARGILEAIYWKPQMSWDVTRVDVLRPPTWVQVRRNEVKRRAHRRADFVAAQAAGEAIFIDAEASRDQRRSLVLGPVAYVIHARVETHGCEFGPMKHIESFNRRVQRGACFQQPFFGMRECRADFGPVDDAVAPIDWSEDLGVMLWEPSYDGGESSWHRASVQNGTVFYRPSDKI